MVRQNSLETDGTIARNSSKASPASALPRLPPRAQVIQFQAARVHY